MERFSPSSSQEFGGKDATKKAALSYSYSREFPAFPPTFLNFCLPIIAHFALQLFGTSVLRSSYSKECRSKPKSYKYILKYEYAPRNFICSLLLPSDLHGFFISFHFTNFQPVQQPLFPTLAAPLNFCLLIFLASKK